GVTRDGLFIRMKDEDWDTVLAVNLTAAFRLSRASLKGMLKRRFGRIINITSVVGVRGNAGQGNYAAAKAGMIGMSKALAADVAAARAPLALPKKICYRPRLSQGVGGARRTSVGVSGTRTNLTPHQGEEWA